jgi:hypothetical protein
MAADWLNNRVARIFVKVRVSEDEETVLARSRMENLNIGRGYGVER